MNKRKANILLGLTGLVGLLALSQKPSKKTNNDAGSMNGSSILSDLMDQFIDTGEKHEGTPILAQTFPNNCRVEFVVDGTFGVYIETIGKDCYRKGYARVVIEKILRVFDKHGLRMELTVDPSGDMNAEALAEFYASFGFEFTGEYDNDDAPFMMRW